MHREPLLSGSPNRVGRRHTLLQGHVPQRYDGGRDPYYVWCRDDSFFPPTPESLTGILKTKITVKSVNYHLVGFVGTYLVT